MLAPSTTKESGTSTRNIGITSGLSSPRSIQRSQMFRPPRPFWNTHSLKMSGGRVSSTASPNSLFQNGRQCNCRSVFIIQTALRMHRHRQHHQIRLSKNLCHTELSGCNPLSPQMGATLHRRRSHRPRRRIHQAIRINARCPLFSLWKGTSGAPKR